jgi:hypothetical protein
MNYSVPHGPGSLAEGSTDYPKDCRYTRYIATFPLHFSDKLFGYSILRGSIISRKSPPFCRYNPLHFSSRIPSRHIFNRRVENIGVIDFPDDLRLISDDLNVWTEPQK